MRALLGHKLPALRASPGSNHGQALRSRKLNARGADTAGGAMDENCLARLSASALKERTIRRPIGHTQPAPWAKEVFDGR